MHYKQSFCYFPRDLYELTNPSKWGVTEPWVRSLGANSRFEYCGSVFSYFIFLVILDIIENNVTFEFPLTGWKWAKLYMKCFQGDEFKRLRAIGKFSEIDFIASEFKGYQIFFQWGNKDWFKEKPVYVNTKLKNYIASKVNQGKQYY